MIYFGATVSGVEKVKLCLQKKKKKERHRRNKKVSYNDFSIYNNQESWDIDKSEEDDFFYSLQENIVSSSS